MNEQEPEDLDAGQSPLGNDEGSVPFARPVTEFAAIPSEEARLAPLAGSPPPRPRIWTVFAVAVTAFVAAPIAVVVYMLGFTSIGSEALRTSSLLDELAKKPTILLGTVVTSLAVLFLLATLGALLSPVPWRQRLRLTAPAMTPGQLLIGAVGAVTIGVACSMADALGFLPRSSTLESLGGAMTSLPSEHFIWAVLVIGIMPGIAEEFLFRGYIQTRLSQRWPAGWSVGVASFLFAAYHMDLGQGLFAFGAGVYFGWLAERAGSIIPAMLAHTANNTVSVLLSKFIPEPEGRLVHWALLIAAVLIAAWCIRHLRRREAPVLQAPASLAVIPDAAATVETNASSDKS